MTREEAEILLADVEDPAARAALRYAFDRLQAIEGRPTTGAEACESCKHQERRIIDPPCIGCSPATFSAWEPA